MGSLANCFLYLYFYSLSFDAFNFLGLGTPGKYFAAFYLISVVFFNRGLVFPKVLILYLTPLFFWVVQVLLVSVLNINAISNSILNTSFLLNVVLFAFFVSHEVREPGVLRNGLVFFVFGSATLTIAYLFGYGVSYDGGRVTIFEDNQNSLALRLGVALLISSYLVLKEFPRLSFKFFLLLGFIPFFLLFSMETGSRSGLAVIVVGSFLLFFSYKPSKFRYRIVVFVFALFFGSFFGYKLAESEVMSSRIDKVIVDSDLGGRENIWSELLQKFDKSPVFGNGFSGYDKIAIEIFGKKASAHSAAVEIFLYSGIVGSILFFTFIFLMARSALKIWLWSKDILPILLMVPVTGMLFAAHLLNVKLAWVIFAVVLGEFLVLRRLKSQHGSITV